MFIDARENVFELGCLADETVEQSENEIIEIIMKEFNEAIKLHEADYHIILNLPNITPYPVRYINKIRITDMVIPLKQTQYNLAFLLFKNHELIINPNYKE